MPARSVRSPPGRRAGPGTAPSRRAGTPSPDWDQGSPAAPRRAPLPRQSPRSGTRPHRRPDAAPHRVAHRARRGTAGTASCDCRARRSSVARASRRAASMRPRRRSASNAASRPACSAARAPPIPPASPAISTPSTELLPHASSTGAKQCCAASHANAQPIERGICCAGITPSCSATSRVARRCWVVPLRKAMPVTASAPSMRMSLTWR